MPSVPNASNDHKNLLAVNLSLAANALLAVLKTVVGIVGHSSALLADGINSTSDVVFLAIVRVYIRLAGKPPDREHPYGHRQLESISAVIVGAFVVTTGVAVFISAADHSYNLLSGRRESVGATVATLWVALLSIAIKVFMAVYTWTVSKKTGSIAVLAVARDHRIDIFSIGTATVGILFSRAGYVWVDPAAAAMVALFILYTGVEIIRESSADLMNIFPERTVRERIRRLIAAVPGVEEVEDIRVHRIGLSLLVDTTIGVDGALSVAEGDAIASDVEKTLRRHIDYVRRVSVHYHPTSQRGPEADRT